MNKDLMFSPAAPETEEKLTSAVRALVEKIGGTL